MMLYSGAYHLRCELTLQSGRVITLVDLHQRQTYTGLLEGAPSAECNDEDIQRALVRAKKAHDIESPPFLIQPRRTKHLRAPGDMDHIPGNSEGYRPTEWLPMVTCVGYFSSTSPAKRSMMDGSHLVVVWFQDEFGLPTDDFIAENFTTLDWDAHASDFEW